MKIFLWLWAIELIGTLIIGFKMENENDPDDRDYKGLLVKWLWLQLWLFTLLFFWFSPLESLSEKAFSEMG